jgi:hypothetical protein
MIGALRFGAVVAVAGGALLGGCGETMDRQDGAVGGAAGALPSGGKAGAKPSGGTGAKASGGNDAGGTGGGAGSEPVDACASQVDEAPGEPLYSEMELGAKECQGIALGQVLSEIREARPDLADVSELYRPDPDRAGDGSFVYAFRRPDGGFAVVLKRRRGLSERLHRQRLLVFRDGRELRGARGGRSAPRFRALHGARPAAEVGDPARCHAERNL